MTLGMQEHELEVLKPKPQPVTRLLVNKCATVNYFGRERQDEKQAHTVSNYERSMPGSATRA